MFILDTNVLSELRKIGSGRENPDVGDWAKSQSVKDFFLASITIMEVEAGILRKARKDAVQASMLRQWMNDHVLPRFSGRILPFGEREAIRCAALHVPDPIAERDGMIAAIALVHDFTIVTRNVKDFRSTGVRILDPWVSR